MFLPSPDAGCGRYAGGQGYNSIGHFCGGWAGNCGDGGIGGSTWYLVCDRCREKYLREKQAAAREKVFSAHMINFYLLNSAVFLMGILQKVFFLHWSSRTNFKILLKVCKYVDINYANLTSFFKLNFLKPFAQTINPEAIVETIRCSVSVCKGRKVVEMYFVKGREVVEMYFVIEGILQQIELSNCFMS